MTAHDAVLGSARMVLGLLLAGMAVGGAAAGLWLVAGGSVLAAIGLYSLVSTAFVLGAAALSYWFSGKEAEESAAALEELRAAE